LFLEAPIPESQYFVFSMLINMCIVYVFQLESEDNRKTFVSSARTLLRQYAFDGLDLAWEFPEIYVKKDRGTFGEYRC
jgi:GH18 family chitinase